MLDGILAVILIICLYTDLTRKKIYNLVTINAMLLGLIIQAWTGGMAGVRDSFYGIGVGFLVFFLPFLVKGISAGDLKLLAAVGALKGPVFVGEAALLTAACGGLYALVLLLLQGRLRETLAKIWQIVLLLGLMPGRMKVTNLSSYGEKSIRIPYGLAIFSGTVLAWFWR